MTVCGNVFIKLNVLWTIAKPGLPTIFWAINCLILNAELDTYYNEIARFEPRI